MKPYRSQKTVEVSTLDQMSDFTLQKIVQSYLPELHREELGEESDGYQVLCVSKTTADSNVEYHINLFNKLNGKKFRSIVRVESENEFKELEWNEVVEISLDHYRLDESERAFISSFQKLTQNEL